MAQVHMIRAQTAKDPAARQREFESAARMYRDHIEAGKCAVEPSLLKKDALRKSILSYQLYVNEDGRWIHRHAGPAMPKESADAYTNLANALFMADQLDEAERAYRLALSYDPKAELPTRNLQVTYSKAKSLNRLKPAAETSSSVTPGVPVPTGWQVLPARPAR